jgi:S-formylglutathione hydrolase
MNRAELKRFDLNDPTHGRVPCATLQPAAAVGQLPLCVFLYGGGGSRESLVDIRDSLEQWWASGDLPPLMVATPDVGPWSFYLDDAPRGLAWESFVVQRFLPHCRSLLPCAVDATPSRTGMVGISMGGYGALKMAFARPDLFDAVAAISPMLEPSVDATTVRPRNRHHYPPEVPRALLGPERDPALFHRDHPVARAQANAAALLVSQPAIYVDAAGADALHAHDGAEFLHRALWALDLAHEYRLRRDSDHAGPDLLERIQEAFAWVAWRLQPPAAAPLTPLESAWLAWIDDPSGTPPATALTAASALFPRVLRALLAPQRAAAARVDPTFSRRYGLL